MFIAGFCPAKSNLKRFTSSPYAHFDFDPVRSQTFYDAADHCRQQEARLPVIKSVETLVDIYQQQRCSCLSGGSANNMWIGLHQRDESYHTDGVTPDLAGVCSQADCELKGWRWTDGTPYLWSEVSDFFNAFHTADVFIKDAVWLLPDHVTYDENTDLDDHFKT